MKRRLIIFTRYPRPGETKTRLIPALGPDGAVEIQRAMTEHTVSIARNALLEDAIEVRYDGGTAREMREWLGDDVTYAAQGDGSLGERMVRSLADVFDGGAGSAVVIGCDCPGLSAEHLSEAFAALDGADCILGPALDGGYYLIGLTPGAFVRAGRDMFDGISWGTGTVFNDTLAAAEANGLAVHVLETLADVDRPEDLDVWYRVHGNGWGSARGKSAGE